MAQRILIIDDDQELVTTGRLALRRFGFEVQTAPDGDAGLELLAQTAGAIDLILLDVMMPGVTGWQVLQTIKANQNYAHIPIVMLTAYTLSADDVAAATHAGLFAGYLVKPVSIYELVAKINAVIAARSLNA